MSATSESKSEVLSTVLLELLDQYMMGGVQPTRDDLDHVFLRFG